MNFFLFQMLGVVSEVILNECSDEVVAVIVTFMHTQVEWVFSSFACLDEVFRLESAVGAGDPGRLMTVRGDVVVRASPPKKAICRGGSDW